MAESLGLTDNDISLLQIDGSRRKVYLKCIHDHKLESLLNETQGAVTYRHIEGVQSTVQIDKAGMGVREIRIANLPPEVANAAIRDALGKYGEILDIKDDCWSTAYRFNIPNGIRLIKFHLKKHMPSRMVIAGNTVEVTYQNQPATCYLCHETGHIFTNCPQRRRGIPRKEGTSKPTWADIVEDQSEEVRDGGKDRSSAKVKATQEVTDEYMGLQASSQGHETSPDAATEETEGGALDEYSIVGDNTAISVPLGMPVAVKLDDQEHKQRQTGYGGHDQVHRPPPLSVLSDVRAVEPGHRGPVPPKQVEAKARHDDVDMPMGKTADDDESMSLSPKRPKKFKPGDNVRVSRERTRSKARLPTSQ